MRRFASRPAAVFGLLSTLALVFAVAVAAPGGDTISFEENKAIREISDELGFTLSELNEVRRGYAERMEVVQMARAAGEGEAVV